MNGSVMETAAADSPYIGSSVTVDWSGTLVIHVTHVIVMKTHVLTPDVTKYTWPHSYNCDICFVYNLFKHGKISVI